MNRSLEYYIWNAEKIKIFKFEHGWVFSLKKNS